MYEIEEFYAVDGVDLKDLLKGCIYNYYIRNKDKLLSVNASAKINYNHIIDTNNKYELSSKKGSKNVQTV